MLTSLLDGQIPLSLRVAGLVVAALVALPLGYTLRLSLSSRRWPSTDGTIVASEVVESVDSESCEIRYRYCVEGREYSGCRVHFGLPLGYRFDSGPSDVVASYRPGARTRVFYDPKCPARAVLEPGPRAFTFVLLVSAVATAVALAWPLVTEWLRRASPFG
ncbi:MAG: DUF3592 domain-containing protein [Phycisphaerae bacterium]|nr:DUF3592 domain-containing protein [Phycisphaerae bacterium]